MALDAERRDKVRVRVDLTAAEAGLLELLRGRLAVRSRADLLKQAYGTFLWIVDEMLSGRRVVSIEPEMMDQLERFKELIPIGGERFLMSLPCWFACGLSAGSPLHLAPESAGTSFARCDKPTKGPCGSCGGRFFCLQ